MVDRRATLFLATILSLLCSGVIKGCSSHGVQVNFSENVVVVDDRTWAIGGTATLTLPLRNGSGSLVVSTNSSVQIIIAVYNTSMQANYREVDIATNNDNAYNSKKNPPMYRNLTSLWCKYPIPLGYTVKVETQKFVSGGGLSLDCADARFRNQSRLCPHGQGRAYRVYNRECTQDCSKGASEMHEEYFGKEAVVLPGTILPTSSDCNVQMRVFQKDCPNVKTPPDNTTSALCTAEFLQLTSCLKKIPSSHCSECVAGEASIISIDTIDSEMICHLRFSPNDHLYALSYTIVFQPPPHLADNAYLRSLPRYASQDRANVGVALHTSIAFMNAKGVAAIQRRMDTILGGEIRLSHDLGFDADSFLAMRIKGPKQNQPCLHRFTTLQGSTYTNNIGVISTDSWNEYTYFGATWNAAFRAQSNAFLYNATVSPASLLFNSGGFYAAGSSLPLDRYEQYSIEGECYGDWARESQSSPRGEGTYLLNPQRNFTVSASISDEGSPLAMIFERGVFNFEGCSLTWLEGVSEDAPERTLTLTVSLQQCVGRSDELPALLLLITVGLMHKGEVLTRYDVVTRGCSPLQARFTIPSAAAELGANPDNRNTSSNSLGEERDYSVYLADGSQSLVLSSNTVHYTPSVYTPVPPSTPFVAPGNSIALVSGMVSGIAIIVALFVLVLVYQYYVKDMGDNLVASDCPDDSPLFKKWCWRIRQRMGSRSKPTTFSLNSFNPQKHLMLVLLLLISGIIRSLTFTFVGYLLIYRSLTYNQYQTLSQLPSFYENITHSAKEISLEIDTYRRSEQERQNNFSDQEVNKCLAKTNYLSYLVNKYEDDTRSHHQDVMDRCPLREAYRVLLVAQASSTQKSLESWYALSVNEYIQQVESDYKAMNEDIKLGKIMNDLSCLFAWAGAPCFGDHSFNQKTPPRLSSNPPNPQQPNVEDDENSSSEPEDESANTTTSSSSWTTSFTYSSASIRPPAIYFPTFQIPIPVLPFDIPWPGWEAFFLSLVITFDVLEIIFKIMRTLDSVGRAVEGEWEESELKEQVFDRDNVPLNMLAEEREKADVLMTQGSTFIIRKLHFCFTGWIHYVWKNWIVVIWKVDQLMWGFILFVIFGIAGFILFSLLTPGIVESMHLTSIVVQPVRFNIVSSNNDILLHAVRLNTHQLVTATRQQDTSLSQLKENVDSFNKQESRRMRSWRYTYQSAKNATMGLRPPADLTGFEFCDPEEYPTRQVNFSLLLAMAGNTSTNKGGRYVFCPLQLVQAYPYVGFNENEFETKMIVTAGEYILAIRWIVTSFFATVAVVIAFSVVMDVCFEVFWYLMKRFGGVRMRKKYWYEPRFVLVDMSRVPVSQLVSYYNGLSTSNTDTVE